eukprot:GHVL01034671.1.p1 GENE.GHVL01034671.1~~GHVL01034671.1.p1  ORF type:complete len:794 (-),score=133.43 GHVL01034671.1:370-2505(-)
MKQEGSWYLTKVMGLSTVHREYQGLMSLPELHLCDYILSPKRALKSKEAVTRLQVAPTLIKKIKEQFNDTQTEALLDCLKISGITLVQGPPGTGKTTTILALLSLLLNSKISSKAAVSELNDRQNNTKNTKKDPKDNMRKLIKAQPWMCGVPYKNWHDEFPVFILPVKSHEHYPKSKQTDDTFQVSDVTEKHQPKKLLVCSPSNAAIDEILRRIVHDGIWDEDGEKHRPQAVRVGPNVHPSLAPWGLEQMTDVRLKAKIHVESPQREAIKMGVLTEARIVCATLSVCGGRDLTSVSEPFDTVIIDEASQGVEISTLIPLKLGGKRLILVGDPNQLPATVFSKRAEDSGYEQSLFQRLQLAGVPVNMLKIQYRMHPQISQFPSRAFYEGKLEDAENIVSMCGEQVFWNLPCFKPLVFFHVEATEVKEGSSTCNPEEAIFVVHILETLHRCFPDVNWLRKVAVISPYAQQVQLIRNNLRALYGVSPRHPCPIDVNTVDGFQGREKDCVIFSAVRSHPNKSSIGFLADRRRLNVALTRARLALWVVGHSERLSQNSLWKSFIDQLELDNRIIRVDPPRETFLFRFLRNWFRRFPDSWRPLNVPFLERLDRESEIDRKEIPKDTAKWSQELIANISDQIGNGNEIANITDEIAPPEENVSFENETADETANLSDALQLDDVAQEVERSLASIGITLKVPINALSSSSEVERLTAK